MITEVYFIEGCYLHILSGPNGRGERTSESGATGAPDQPVKGYFRGESLYLVAAIGEESLMIRGFAIILLVGSGIN